MKENAENRADKTVLKEKIDEMMKYALPLLDNFPRKNRRIADVLRNSLLEMCRLSTEIEKSFYRKSNLQKLDVELAEIREFVALASDEEYCSEKYAPPLTKEQRETWNGYADEIGRIIGAYIKAINSKTD